MTSDTPTATPDDLRLLTIDEAAALLHISKRQLYKLCKDRLVPHRKVEGVSIRFSQQDIRDIEEKSYRPVVER